MSIQWEKLEGGTDDFAVRMAFHQDPDNGLASTAEEAASWGAFQIWVDGRNLCAHWEENEYIDSVHWYLLPMLEWFARNWDELLHEERLPIKNSGDDARQSLERTGTPSILLSDDEADQWETRWADWWSRHNLQACRTGGLFPDVTIRRWRHLVEVSWGRSEVIGSPEHFRFVSNEGFARKAPPTIAEPLFSVLSEASAHLLKLHPQSQRLMRLQSQLQKAKTDASEKRLALLAGLGTSIDDIIANWKRVRKRLAKAPENARKAIFSTNDGNGKLAIEGSCHAALMFGTLSPTIKENDLMFLAERLVDLFTEKATDNKINKYAASQPILDSDDVPWELGYDFAERIIDKLNLVKAQTEWIDVELLLRRLGVNLEEIDLDDGTIRAVAIAGKMHRPTILINHSYIGNRRPAGRRFTLAHELCHLLLDREYGMRLALVSGPWAPKQLEQRANAFAAMLLMPTELIVRTIDSLDLEINSVDDVIKISKILKVSLTAAIEHLHNLGFISEEVRDQIRSEIEIRVLQESL